MRFRSQSYFTYPALICTALISALVLSEGCSGGGGHLPSTPTPTPSSATPTPTPTATPDQTPVIAKASINWGTRTRATTPATTGPVIGLSAALSATIALRSPTTGDVIASWNAERPDGNLGGVVAYPSPNTVAPGIYLLTVTFYPEHGESGSPLGVAQASATVQPTTGVLSYTISTVGTVATVALTGVSVNGVLQPTETVNGASVPKLHIGQNGDLVYALLDSSGNLLAQSVNGTATGSASSVTVSDSTRAHVTLGDRLIGDLPGTITVKITVDGVTSAASPVILYSDAKVVASSANLTVSRGVTVPVSVSVTGDPTNSGVTFQIITPTTNPDNTGGAGSFAANADNLSGIYTAPITTDPTKSYTYIVRATSVYDPDTFADTTITVQSLVDVTVTNPASGVADAAITAPDTLMIHQVVNFASSVANVPSGQNGVTWSLRTVDASNNTVTGNYGTLSASGVYTAPVSATPAGAIVVVRATSKFDPNKFQDFYLTVQSLVTVSVTDSLSGVTNAPQANPDIVSINRQVQFNSDVQNVPTGQGTVVWSLSTIGTGGPYGSISSSGVYSAPSTPTPGDVIVVIRATSTYDPAISKDYYLVVRDGDLSVGVH